eukprot:8968946-Pyramimonas_sp.AAC.1
MRTGTTIRTLVIDRSSETFWKTVLRCCDARNKSRAVSEQEIASLLRMLRVSSATKSAKSLLNLLREIYPYPARARQPPDRVVCGGSSPHRLSGRGPQGSSPRLEAHPHGQV